MTEHTVLAVYQIGETQIQVINGDATDIPSDAILCGAMKPFNPLWDLYDDAEYWGAGLAWAYTESCPEKLYFPQDDPNIVDVESSVVKTKMIGIINPQHISIVDCIVNTVKTIGDSQSALKPFVLNIVAPKMRDTIAGDVVAAALEIAHRHPFVTQINVTDRDSAAVYCHELKKAGIERHATSQKE
ncbi:MAG: hypothetical protein O3B13_21035 [Planctomycetota bacterium]|nr:hypothetical protein [Planctomycetota bacterium]